MTGIMYRRKQTLVLLRTANWQMLFNLLNEIDTFSHFKLIVCTV